MPYSTNIENVIQYYLTQSVKQNVLAHEIYIFKLKWYDKIEAYRNYGYMGKTPSTLRYAKLSDLIPNQLYCVGTIAGFDEEEYFLAFRNDMQPTIYNPHPDIELFEQYKVHLQIRNLELSGIPFVEIFAFLGL